MEYDLVSSIIRENGVNWEDQNGDVKTNNILKIMRKKQTRQHKGKATCN
jgi:hypothetical protein